MKKFMVVFATLILFCANVFSDGMLVPVHPDVPPLGIKYQRVNITIDNGIAKTKVNEAFKNPTNRQLEAIYYFPIPEGASITDFALWIGGKRTSGEVIEKEKAAKIYQEIVAKMKDPGILEYMGGNIFRAKVFPVPANGEQQIEIEYSYTLPYNQGIYEYSYPLKMYGSASIVVDELTISYEILSKTPIKSVYSPSYEIDSKKENDNKARGGFEKTNALLDKDFTLYYTVSESEFGMRVMSYKKDDDGYFSLMVAPPYEVEKEKIVNRDIIFVIDTSGSMSADNKMEQAKKALKFCVASLNAGDRFNIVRFSSAVELFSPDLLEYNTETRSSAEKFIEKMKSIGSTAINEALLEALRFGDPQKRPVTILFITDGLPTVGETNISKILENVKEKNKNGVRYFTFGVGYDVNTVLLDSLSSNTKGLCEYIKPQEDIEMKISSLYSKISAPVLTDVKIDWGKIEVYDVYPKVLPDIFRGSQLLIMGRYKTNGHTAIRLIGQVNKQEKIFTDEGTFSEKDERYDFVPAMWANRKIGYLLEQIRLHGDTKEVKDEVIYLAKKFGIVTPYTSYLVLENDDVFKQYGIERMARATTFKPANKIIVGSKSGNMAPKSEITAGAPSSADALGKYYAGGGGSGAASDKEKQIIFESLNMELRGTGKITESGEIAVKYSKELNALKNYEVAKSSNMVKNVGSKTFYNYNGYWIDNDSRDDKPTIEIKFNTDAYFKLFSNLSKEQKKYATIGKNVVLYINGYNVKISETGKETISDEDIKKIFGK